MEMGSDADFAALNYAEDQQMEAQSEAVEPRTSKKEVLNHLEKYCSLQDSDFLPPGTVVTFLRISTFTISNLFYFYDISESRDVGAVAVLWLVLFAQ